MPWAASAPTSTAIRPSSSPESGRGRPCIEAVSRGRHRTFPISFVGRRFSTHRGHDTKGRLTLFSSRTQSADRYPGRKPFSLRIRNARFRIAARGSGTKETPLPTLSRRFRFHGQEFRGKFLNVITV